MTSEAAQRRFFYGWVVVAACTALLAITYGLLYSYSVFFKPLADHFNWDRATVSLIYSASLVIRGAIAIFIGWLADRYGARKLMIFCGFMTGLGLILSGFARSLWQLGITYGLLESIGLSGAFGIGTAIVSRWFTSNRGLALGIIATGSGWGTLFLVPGNERLLNALGLSPTFIICGSVTGIVMIMLASLLRPAPQPPPQIKSATPDIAAANRAPETKLTLMQAATEPRMLLFMTALFLFFLCVQIVMIHLVNYATDLGIDPLVAASFISIIGAVSIGGRLSMGIMAEKIGIHNTLILTRALLILAFTGLIFTRSLWAFYLFAVIFGLPYGGEIPQIPLFIGQYFGTEKLATMVGINMFVLNTGGAVGAWLAGKIFDIARSYEPSFIAGLGASAGSLILILILYRYNRIIARSGAAAYGR